MNIKLIGAFMVVISCSLFGIRMSSSIKSEMENLRDLISILNFMESELQFRLTPLPELCRLCAEQGRTLSILFKTFADELENQVSPDPSICMEAVLCRFSLSSNRVDAYLRELGSSFGKFDLKGQLLGIGSLRQRCVSALEKLENCKDSRIRNYQTISLCIGVVTTIILL